MPDGLDPVAVAALAELARRSGAPAPEAGNNGASLSPAGPDSAPAVPDDPLMAAALGELQRRAGGGKQGDRAPASDGADAAAAAAAGKRTGAGANFAGQIVGIPGDVLGAPHDIVDAAARGIGTAARWAVGAPQPEDGAPRPGWLPNPFDLLPGSADINRLIGDKTGLPTPENTAAVDPWSRVARTIGGAVSTGAELAAGGGGLLRGAKAAGVLLPKPVRIGAQIVSSGGPIGNTAVNAAAGLGQGIGEEVAPDGWKTAAGLAGGLLLGHPAAVGTELTKAGIRAGVPLARDALGAMAAGALETPGARAVGMVPGVRGFAGNWTADRAAANARGAVEAGGGDVGATADALDPANRPAYVPGSAAPTPFEITGNTGIGYQQKALETADRTRFEQRRTQNAEARANALDTLQNGGDPAALSDSLTGQLRAIDGATEQRIGEATAAARAANPDVRGKQAIGEDIQASLHALERQAQAATSRIWEHWRGLTGPDGQPLAYDIGQTRLTAHDLLNPAQGAEPPVGREAALYQRAMSQPSTVTAETAQNLRKTAGELIGMAVRDGDGATARRIGQFRQSLDDSLDAAVARAEGRPAAEAAATAPPAGEGGPAPTTGTRIYTPSGTPVDVRYEVVPGNSLKRAGGDLQPRDRSSAANEALVQRVRTRLNPEQVGAAPSPLEGAPVVGPDHVVESGNGRYSGIMLAHADNGAPIQRYRDWLTAQGFDHAGIENPVLIRRRLTDMSPEERVRFAQESNAPPGESRPHSELAMQDAGRLTPEIMAHWRGGSIADDANADFRRAAAGGVFDRTELGQMLTRDGRLNVEGERRLSAALTHYAYGDAAVLNHFTEAPQEGLQAFGRALRDAAPDMAALRGDVAAGRVPPEMDLAPHIGQAAAVLADARRRGVPVLDALGQSDLLRQTAPQAGTLLRAAYGDGMRGRMSAEQFADYLRFYAREAGLQTTSHGLFGETARTMPEDILRAAGERYGRGAGTVNVGAGEGAGARGAQGGGPGADAGGAAAGGGGAGGLGRAGNLAAAPLTENITPEAADVYGLARAATREKKITFDESAVGTAIKRDTNATGFAKTPEQAADIVWNGSAKGRQALDDYIRAGGSADLLHEAAARSLRDKATVLDGPRAGTLDPRRFEAWAAQHGDKLDRIPGMRQDFATAADASRAIDEAGRRAAVRRDAFLTSAARRFTGGQDPVRAVGSVIGAGPVRGMREAMQLVSLTAKDPAAREALRAAAAEHVLTRFKTQDLIPGAGGQTTTRGAPLAKYIADNHAVLGVLMGEQARDRLVRLADQIRRESMITNLKTPGGPNTAHDLMAAGHGHGNSSLGTVIAVELAEHLTGHVGVGLGGFIAKTLYDRGINSVNRLMTEATLNPDLYRTLLMRATPHSAPLFARSLSAALGRTTAVAAVNAAR
jgi:hypothetical protein